MIAFELVHIKWIDSEVDNQWTEIIEIDFKFTEIHSIGLLLHQDDERYVLAGMYDSDNNSVNAIQFIPRGCVKKVTPLCLIKTMIK